MPLGKVLATCVGAAQRASDIRIELVKTRGTAPTPPTRPLLVSTDDPKRLAEWLEELEGRRDALSRRMARLLEIERETCNLLGKIGQRPRRGRGGPQDWCCGSEAEGEPEAAEAGDGVTVQQLKTLHRERKKAAAAVDCALVALKAAWAETMALLEARGDDLRVLLQRCECEGHPGQEAVPEQKRQPEREDEAFTALVEKIVDEHLAKVGRQTAEARAPATDQPATQTPPANAKSKPTTAT
jgi:hypothetical protein